MLFVKTEEIRRVSSNFFKYIWKKVKEIWKKMDYETWERFFEEFCVLSFFSEQKNKKRTQMLMWCSVQPSWGSVAKIKANQEVKIIIQKLDLSNNKTSWISYQWVIIKIRGDSLEEAKNVTSNNGSRHSRKHSPTPGQTC